MKKMNNKNYQYPNEAFSLMEYECTNCKRVEIIWNSRDGVTPFMISCSDCNNGTMKHINWHNDQYAPNYLPSVGSRIFVSFITIHQIIQNIFDIYTEELWEKIKNKWMEYCSDRYELIWELASHAINDKLRFEHPHIITVTEKNQNQFIPHIKYLNKLKETAKDNAFSIIINREEDLTKNMV